MTNYKAIAETAKKIGENAFNYGALAVSCLTPFVPCDAQLHLWLKTRALEPKTQTRISAIAEFCSGAAMTVYGTTSGNDLLLATCGILAGIEGVWRFEDPPYYSDHKWKGSLVVEVPYHITKEVYNYLKDTYEDAKGEVETEKA